MNCQYSDDISANLEYQADSNGNEMGDAATQLTNRDMIVRKITKTTIRHALCSIVAAASHAHGDHTGRKAGHIVIQSAGTPIRMLAVIITIIAMLTAIIMPTIAYADTAQYQMLDGRKREDQITVNKVWDDGLFPEDRQIIKGKTITAYTDLVAITVQTGVPQAALRTYTITYNANGGTYGTDENGNAITTNTVTYNAKNQPINGTYLTPERTDGYVCVGWSTSKTATTPDITLTNTVTDKWMNEQTDGSTTAIYPVWKDLRINYAVMAYGIGVDKDANGKTMGITFGPALGYPEFSPYNSDKADRESKQTFTKSHSVSGDATVIRESAPACTDDSHSVITGIDAGTDEAGNAYRCLHYDNWATIIYWNKVDPHVYDKCIPNHCSKTVVITPNIKTIENGIFSANVNNDYRGLIGDGQSYITGSKLSRTSSHPDTQSQVAWDLSANVDLSMPGQGYAASNIRAVLVGADSHTNTSEQYAGTDAMTRYTSDATILSCFPKTLQNAIGSKALSRVTAASSGTGMTYDSVSNDGVADKLWLFSRGEMTNAVYPSVGFNHEDNKRTPDATRSSIWWYWMRSPYDKSKPGIVSYNGALYCFPTKNINGLVAPGFTLVR